MKTSEVLRKAADEIRRRGWHQGHYGSDSSDPDSCAVCALGAIHAADRDDPWEDSSDLSFAAASALSSVLDGEYVDVWNDNPERTVEEVLEAFEEAAQKAEQDGD
jgi:hypothetical protein